MLITTLSMSLSAQKVSFYYPGEVYKTSQDNGLTWMVSDEKPQKVTFHYPFGVTKTTGDLGKTWSVTKARFSFIYPGGGDAPEEERALNKRTPGDSEAGFMLYPNPATGQVTVTFSPDGTADLVRIMSMDGTVHKHVQHPAIIDGKVAIDLRGLAGGTYIMSLVAQDRVIGHHRFVISP